MLQLWQGTELKEKGGCAVKLNQLAQLFLQNCFEIIITAHH